jgi:hypothetical protein
MTPQQYSVDPFKRKYQVFVSSTFHDLIDERQRVMSALLQTKCIPVGMELFPAASLDQFDMIKQIIDDCDYYMVIIAGRYGSIPNGSELSFTELEFDYALTKNKPVLGFCHKNVQHLTGDKLEQFDIGRRKLEAFRGKVMKGRMCNNSWTSGAELESQVKSAIIYAIEHYPQPGWIRFSQTQDLSSPSSSDFRTELDAIKKQLGRTHRTITVEGGSTICAMGKGLNGDVATKIGNHLLRIGLREFASTFIGPEHVHYTFPAKTEIPQDFIRQIADEFGLKLTLTPRH